MALRLEQLTLWQFKNHLDRQLATAASAVGFVGRNGQGKTNLLEAIYYLCLSKTWQPLADAKNISWGKEDGFRLSAAWHKNDTSLTSAIICKKDARKQILVLEKPISAQKYIGLFPLVFMQPDSISLINEGARARRNYINFLLSQSNETYLRTLLAYQKIIEQKNAYLKKGNISPQDTLLSIYNEQLRPLNQYLYEARNRIFPVLKKHLTHYYNAIADEGKNDINIHYESQLHEYSWEAGTSAYKGQEIIAGRTLFGIHKDDLIFTLHGDNFKTAASQGQKKTLLLALKLTEYKILQEIKKINPLFLLDDIFEKLDEYRLQRLAALIRTFAPFQIFLTDTQKQRMEDYLKTLSNTYQLHAITTQI